MTIGGNIASLASASGKRRKGKYMNKATELACNVGNALLALQTEPELRGGFAFDEMLRTQPDFFLHSGDTIYADGPVEPEVKLPDGSLWRNVVTREKSKVAETLDEYRGQYRYNLLDQNFRNFIANVAQIWQWDDHEAMNNWSPSKSVLADARYREKNVPLMVSREWVKG